MTEKQRRLILPLLKARITDRRENGFTLSFGSEYGSPTSINISMNTSQLDLHDGDLLTLYTEVLLAKPNPASVQ